MVSAYAWCAVLRRESLFIFSKYEAEKARMSTPIRAIIAKITAEQVAKYRLKSDFRRELFFFAIAYSSFTSNL